MKPTFTTAAIMAIALTGCATRESGIRDPERFRAIAERTELTSARAHDEVAACFRDTAALLPMSDFIDTAPNVVTYRLRGFGYTFEEIDFAAAPGNGARITVLMAPGVNARWRHDFARDRLAPLDACVAPAADQPR
ncbi:MAG: hypothetical protein GC206_16670 [Alphaproteobacteria bacterium]|nr:hypothetical protein [Alphaproteobacteria bacterium]